MADDDLHSCPLLNITLEMGCEWKKTGTDRKSASKCDLEKRIIYDDREKMFLMSCVICNFLPIQYLPSLLELNPVT